MVSSSKRGAHSLWSHSFLFSFKTIVIIIAHNPNLIFYYVYGFAWFNFVLTCVDWRSLSAFRFIGFWLFYIDADHLVILLNFAHNKNRDWSPNRNESVDRRMRRQWRWRRRRTVEFVQKIQRESKNGIIIHIKSLYKVNMRCITNRMDWLIDGWLSVWNRDGFRRARVSTPQYPNERAHACACTYVHQEIERPNQRVFIKFDSEKKSFLHKMKMKT